MHASKRAFAVINVLGGIAVLGSYAYGLATNPDTRDMLWGDVPESLLPLYNVTMLLAAAGYFLFGYFLFFRVDPDTARIAGRFRFPAINWILAAILGFSALWMPLTFAWLDGPSDGLWIAIRFVLFAVGLASLALIAALVRIEPQEPKAAHRLAVAGSIAFTFQTAVLDALVWPAYFPA